jgi:hypothetical protein
MKGGCNMQQPLSDDEFKRLLLKVLAILSVQWDGIETIKLLERRNASDRQIEETHRILAEKQKQLMSPIIIKILEDL